MAASAISIGVASSVTTGFTCPSVAFTGDPSVRVTNATAGENVRIEVDAGAGRNGVVVEILVKDAAGTTTTFYGPAVIITGDGPVEWVGPVLPENLRGKRMRVRILDPRTSSTLDDGVKKIR
ncbi:MAG: hypothetical protein H6834_11695 [Planctomycetes bacterium]|nr:hypothetical protein [Planctomycetota bacterium]